MEILNMMYISSGKERCEILATYMIENQSTVRAAANYFGISKSTVHKDVTQNLKRTNKALYLTSVLSQRVHCFLY